MTNGRPVTIHGKQQLRLTIVNVKLPLLARLRALFSGELVLGIMGTVQDVAVITRADAQDLLDTSHQQKWVPYQDQTGGPSAPTKGPNLC